jgi:hypothetical protein
MCLMMSFTGAAHAELVGYWSFDGNLTDASTSKNDGIAKTGTPAFVTEVPAAIKSSKALSLADRATVNIPNKAGLLDGKAMTLSLWINALPDSPGMWTRVLSKAQKLDKGGVGLEIQRQAKTPELYVRVDTPEVFNQHKKLGDILDGAWHHVVITLDGTNGVFYVDGKPVKHGYKINDTLANTSDLIIGQSSIENQRFFTGMIDDLAIWDKALTPEQVKSLTEGKVTPLDVK